MWDQIVFWSGVVSGVVVLGSFAIILIFGALWRD